jgi:predicted transposase YbfD/YdcC
MKKLTLKDVLEEIEDPRRENSVIYPLYEVLFIVLIAVMCGATSYKRIEMVALNREKWFRKYLKLEYGIPKSNTYRYVLMRFEPAKLHKLFADWMKCVVTNLCGVVALDGKTARRSRSKDKNPLHVVSAYAHDFGVVLGQISCEEKSNEITAIPKLLDMLEIKGSIVTIDAMGTQTEIAKKIVEKEADYILALKENQPSLYEEVSLFFEEYSGREDIKASDTYHAVTTDNEHGRFEKRECFVCSDIEWLNNKVKWAGLSGIGMIISTVQKGENKSVQKQYFIYSCKNMTAKAIMQAKRAHWGIENSLHWVLDMTFREDESRVRKDNSAENFNIVRQIVLNILKLETSKKDSLVNKQFACLLDDKYLDIVISTWVCS